MQAIRAQIVVPQQAQAVQAQRASVPAMVLRPLKAVGAGLATLALAMSANAATVKLASLAARPSRWLSPACRVLAC